MCVRLCACNANFGPTNRPRLGRAAVGGKGTQEEGERDEMRSYLASKQARESQIEEIGFLAGQEEGERERENFTTLLLLMLQQQQQQAT